MTNAEAIMALMGATCEVCGAKAKHAVADTRETAPVEALTDDGPALFATREVTGRHYFCAAHAREPVHA